MDVSNYCPMCQTEKTVTSKHCIICNKCVDGFDHHCYWVNNCVGKANLFLFIVFIYVIAGNILLNIILTIMSLFSTNNPRNYSSFPPTLPWDTLYKDSAKTLISSFVVIIGLIFLIPVL